MSSSAGAGNCSVRRRVIDVGGVGLSVLEAGDGPALVFVHGSVTTSELFRGTLEHFSDRYRSIAVDLRGYGASDKPGFGYTMQQFSDDLGALFDALRLDNIALVGVSMGGFVVQRFALDHQERLAGLVLCATSDGELTSGLVDDDDPADAVKRVGWRDFSKQMITGAFPPTTDPGIVEALIARVDSWNEDVIIGACRSFKQFSTRGQLQNIKVPTLIMAGTEDRQLPVSFSQRMEREIPNSRLEIFNGIGHFMMVEDPVHFHSALGGFLAQLHRYAA